MTLADIARSPVGALLWRSLRAYQIFGANTDVGKTVLATILCTAASKREPTAYLKPVSTGPPNEADTGCSHIARYAPPGVDRTVLVQYDLAASPHLAARLSGKPVVPDQQILRAVHQFAADRVAASKNAASWLFVETAGGVHSPAPSGTTQADLYAALRLPVVLVGDTRLGGISQTIAAFESLRMRGYDVATVLVFRDGDGTESASYQNHAYLADYFGRRYQTPVAVLPPPPERRADDHPGADQTAMARYYSEQAGGSSSSSSSSSQILAHLRQLHEERVAQLDSMAERAAKSIWYPFTQQKQLTPEKITVLDAAHGSYFQTLAERGGEQAGNNNDSKNNNGPRASLPLLQPSFDASASWWTQGLGHGHPRLALAAAYAAGRYGHVMFAEAVHAPALALAETMLAGLANPRLTRVFYSDNGSTGIEVALKMALKAARQRSCGDDGRDDGQPTERDRATTLDILGLQGSYHGDTLGAMACAQPSTYNEKVEWYGGRGHWFACPSVQLVRGTWRVTVPGEIGTDADENPAWVDFSSLADIMDVGSRAGSALQRRYAQYIARTIRDLLAQGRRFGALLMEPVVLGAGGMVFVDPLFQQTLVNVVRHEGLFGQTADGTEKKNDWSGLPIIFDEVFTGLYRLGRFAAASFLQVQPDISVHAKLLTGGTLPLCTTLASESIFAAFSSDDKSDALLHGHSYTAHAVGCQTALESLGMLRALDAGRGGDDGQATWQWAKRNWAHKNDRNDRSDDRAPPPVWSVWSPDLLVHLSQREAVQGVWALGSVLAVHLHDVDGRGYKSNAARAVQAKLAEGDAQGTAQRWNVHSRVLGNVLYLMADQMSAEEDIRRLEELLSRSV